MEDELMRLTRGKGKTKENNRANGVRGMFENSGVIIRYIRFDE